MGWWNQPQGPTKEELDELAQLGDIEGMYRSPYDSSHFLTPLERVMIELFKTRPGRMRQIQRDMQWLRKQLRKRGIVDGL